MRSRAYGGLFSAAALALSCLLVPKIAAAAHHENYKPGAELYVGEDGFSCPTGFSIGTAAKTTNPVPPGAFLLGGAPNGGGIDANPISLTIPPGPDQTVDITVTDCCLGGDAYQVIVDGVLVGTTPLVKITGEPPPTPPFTVTVILAPGGHTINIHDATFSFIGKNPVPPFPAGSLDPVPADYSPAGLTVTATCVAHPGCPLTQEELARVREALPPGVNYLLFERIGPSAPGDSPGLCASSTTVTECDPTPGSENPCGTNAAFRGSDSISVDTSGDATCDTACKTLGGIRRCFEVCN